LVAGDVSKAHDLLSTFRLELPKDPDADEVFDMLNAASNSYKKKLCERFVSQKLGMTLERFLAKGEKELTPEVRNRTLLQLEELTFECELIVAKFIDNEVYLFSIEGDGGVVRHQNFAAIGTGSVIARSTLYQRAQTWQLGIEPTLYNLYEAAQLARIAPGVGDISEFLVTTSSEDGRLEGRITSPEYRKLLGKTFKSVGPKPLSKYYVLQPQHLIRLGEKARADDEKAAKQPANGQEKT